MNAGDGCAIWMYGSHARGDADSLSDVDLLVVSDFPIDKEQIASTVDYPSRLSISWYTWREIEGMAEYGSLFLQHVHLEGRAVYEAKPGQGRLRTILSDLPEYGLAIRDLEGFQTVLADVNSSLCSRAHLTYELATLATLFRHACILGCAISGGPCFSRFEPVIRVVRRWTMVSYWSQEFPTLYAYRMYAEGRSEYVAKPSPNLARMWYDRASLLLNELELRIYARN